MSPDNLEAIKAAYLSGKTAFERGEYRKSVEYLERATGLVERQSRLGGEIQTWLVTAYEAAGQRTEAIALCRELSRHADLNTRKQGKRLLYILEAPRLKTNPEWLTQIPDLSGLADSDSQDRKGTTMAAPTLANRSFEKPAFQLEPEDVTQRNTRDNRFIWVALLAAILVLGSLFWFA